MKKIFFAIFVIILLIAHTNQLLAANFTGAGGRGTRIAVMELGGAERLHEEESHLPSMVQSVLVGDLSRFSAMYVLDRQRLEIILREIESGIYQTEADIGRLGEIENVDYILTGSITRTATGHFLEVHVRGTGRAGRGNLGVIRASFTGTPTVAEISDLTGIRRASMELLTQMGVNLTASARQELSGAATASRVSGEIALARGITAQRRGTEVAALSYYFQAAAFDPTLLEAVNRSSILHANVASGNIGDDVRNEIAWRRDWVARLTETEQFFADFHRREPMPYTLFYTIDITRGEINWQMETVDLSIETHLHGSGVWTVSIEHALQAVYDGLRATGRAQTWGLGNWPRQGVTNLNAFFARRSNNFTVVFELLNDRNMVIGRQTLQAGGSWELSWVSGRPRINVDASVRTPLHFRNVNANDITDRMTIRVASANGIDAATAARDGVLQIRAISRNDFARYDNSRFERGEIRGGSANPIPDTIWGDPVISIGNMAFLDRSLSNVAIPSSVTYIGNHAFSRNRLTHVTIGDNVVRIGDRAFWDNRLTSITIPDGVTHIGHSAFAFNQLTSVLIPDSVTHIGGWAFQNNRLTSVSIPVHTRIEETTFDSGVRITRRSGSHGSDLTGQQLAEAERLERQQLAEAERLERQRRAEAERLEQQRRERELEQQRQRQRQWWQTNGQYVFWGALLAIAGIVALIVQ